MAREFSYGFYHSKAWKDCRDSYIATVNGLCERCLKKGKLTPGYILHHIEHLTPENIRDPFVTLNWSNLEYVCQSCHNEEHFGKYDMTREGYTFDENGYLVEK